MKGERKSNGHKERWVRQAFKRNIVEREKDYPQFNKEFGHLKVFLSYIDENSLSSLI